MQAKTSALATLAGLFILAAGALFTVPASAATSAQCTAAQAMVTHYLADHSDSRAWIVQSGAADGPAGLEMADLKSTWKSGWKKDAPSKALSTAFIQGKDVNALEACPGLRQMLDSQKVAYGDAAVAAATAGVKEPQAFPKRILWLALPVLSAGGDEALVDVGLNYGPVASFGQVQHLRKSASGVWTTRDMMRTWSE